MPKVSPIGKVYAVTEPDEALNTTPVLGRYRTPNGTVLPVRRAFANVDASSTDEELIPANENAAIRIIALFMVAGATATDVTLYQKEDGESAAEISPLIANAANGGAVLPLNEQGWFQTPDVNQAVVVTTGAGSATGILALFLEIPPDNFDLL